MQMVLLLPCGYKTGFVRGLKDFSISYNEKINLKISTM